MTTRIPLDVSAWSKAEPLARRIYELGTVPMRPENHPNWDPSWRAAIEKGLSALGSGDDAAMEHALREIERLALTL
jgi:hypothetical protein